MNTRSWLGFIHTFIYVIFCWIDTNLSLNIPRGVTTSWRIVQFVKMPWNHFLLKFMNSCFGETLSPFAGKLVPFIELTVAHASILTILAISFERYYAICEPLKAGYVCTKTRAMVICVVCWFVAGLFTRYEGTVSAFRGHLWASDLRSFMIRLNRNKKEMRR